ncbi:PP2C family protein-serine/threonine phosphatase [Actinacidiphila bryophytorum]|uniref:Serine/threonine-protein phosphatase n=1 Tax=Actinacidiphila bryophytorum TaxID=1436133 RepID=A0A9W4MJH3_9ACTN|nr:PP2C family protein-serine/threonine phosphatase [Actinacidiphila bryophytorum]MBM9436828.1 serine/threonine-protein phosphatase [Actinacidiphila bryophytorum]MBN6542329.1 serine/threonine-protein phosphatase [Actinacidiphila bryophytorum]CAG7654477.1 Serine/threonine-protein phosphatase [Actinacidiphila bryophytorum]
MTNFLSVERALRTAAPHALLDVVRSVLAAHYGAHAVDLLMADYSQSVLQPVTALPHTAVAVSTRSSVQGRAFGSQEPQQEISAADDLIALHLPVTVRGDRLGVLTVRLTPSHCTAVAVRDLVDIAGLLGHEILVAERDTDVYLQARRVNRLTLAAEMQWQLLPARACARTEYSIGAQLEPAYAIRGDNFDWASTAENLTLTITNGMGEGIEASLLTNLAVNALRNARRAGIGIADQAALADQALYAEHGGSAHVSTLLLSFDLATGHVQVVDAGSPQLWRQRDKSVERVPFEAQLPLGMFDQTEYVLQEFRVLPGDRLIFVSDGVYAASSPAGEAYEKQALSRAITAAGLLAAADVPGAVLRELAAYRDADAEDDALVVCLDWHGRTSPT